MAMAVQTDSSPTQLLLPPATQAKNSIEVDATIPPQLWKALPGMALGMFTYNVDIVLEFSAYPKIGSEFHETNHVAWLTLAYTISAAATQLLYSHLSDSWGRQPLLLCSYIWFAAGVLLCALSQNFWFLVLARGIVGVGSAGMGYMVSIILNDLVRRKDRGTWQAYPQICNIAGQLVGGICGGLLLDRIGWRYTFPLQIPLAALAFALVNLTLPPTLTSQQRCTRNDIAAEEHPLSETNSTRFDYLGSLFLFFIVSTLVLGLNIAGNEAPWNDPRSFSLLFASAVFLGLFISIEHRTSVKTLLPLHLFVKGENWAVFGTTFFVRFGTMAILYLLPFYNSVTSRHTTAIQGLLLTLVAVGEGIGYLAAGFMISLTRRPKVILVPFIVAHLFASVYISRAWTGAESITESELEIIAIGICAGAMSAATLVMLLESNTESESAAMFGALHLFVSVANLVSVSVMAAVIQYNASASMQSGLGSGYLKSNPGLVNRCLQSLDCLVGLPDEVQRVVRQSFIQAIGNALEIVSLAIAVSLLFSLATVGGVIL